MLGWEERDEWRGWKWWSLNLAVSLNIRACSMGVYAKRSLEGDEDMNERVRRRQALPQSCQ